MRILFLTLLFLTSCTSFKCDIKDLQQKKVSSEQLPNKVKDYLYRVSLYDSTFEIMRVVNTEDSCNYRLEYINTIIGPWTAYIKLTDISNNMVYKIAPETPGPFIIFNHELFIPDRYNIFIGNNFETCMYTVYELRGNQKSAGQILF